MPADTDPVASPTIPPARAGSATEDGATGRPGAATGSVPADLGAEPTTADEAVGSVPLGLNAARADAPSAPVVASALDEEDAFPAAFVPPAWLSARKVTAILVVVFTGLAVFFLLGALRDFLILLFVSFFLSLALEPAVSFLAKHGWRRGAATWLMFLAFFASLAVFAITVVPQLIDQIGQLADDLPGRLDELTQRAPESGGFLSDILTPERIQEARTGVEDWLRNSADDVFGIGLTVLGAVLQALAIFLFTWYLAADGPKWRRAIAGVLPARRQRQFLDVYELAMAKMGGYVYTRVLLATIAGTTTWLVLLLLGVPGAFVLGFFTGATSLIPVVGTYIGAVPPVLFALVQVSTGAALAVLAFIVVYQQIENLFISPRLTKRSLELHPAVAFAAVLIGGAVLGAVGALLALPVAAIIVAIFSEAKRYQPIEADLLVEPSPAVKKQRWWERLRREGNLERKDAT